MKQLRQQLLGRDLEQGAERVRTVVAVGEVVAGRELGPVRAGQVGLDISA